MNTQMYEVRFNERIDFLTLEQVRFLLKIEECTKFKCQANIKLKDGRVLLGRFIGVTARYSQLTPNQVDIPLRFVLELEDERIELLYFEIESFEAFE